MLLFQTPQFRLLPDPQGHRLYANVDNLLEIATQEGLATAPVQVPASLFVLMKDVLRVKPESSVSLAVDEVEQGEDVRYVFSLLVDDQQIYDLWDYSPNSLPAWLLEVAKG